MSKLRITIEATAEELKLAKECLFAGYDEIVAECQEQEEPDAEMARVADVLYEIGRQLDPKNTWVTPVKEELPLDEDDPLAHPCGYCGAQPGEPCVVTTTGNAKKKPHKGRGNEDS